MKRLDVDEMRRTEVSILGYSLDILPIVACDDRLKDGRGVDNQHRSGTVAPGSRP
ncbi:MAG: hypothetical protein WCD11_01125 [Solirubrobacteraceae bacterium]